MEAAWRRRRLLEVAFLALLLLIPILLYLPFLNMPFERDEGTYATVAQGLLDGKLPYRDLFDNKPPLVYGWYAISFLLFGESVIAPRLLAAACLSLTAVALYHQSRMFLPKGAAGIAAFLFAISTGLPWVALNANTEAYMLLPLVLSLLCFTQGIKDGRARWFFMAGLAAGVAIMTKQVAVFNLLALATVALVWYARKDPWQWRSLVPSGAMIGGALITTAIIALPFALSGALDDFFYALVSYNWLYVSFVSMAKRLTNMGYGVLFFTVIAAPLVAGALGGLGVLWRKRETASVTDYAIILWAFASAIGVASGGRFFPHYFMQLLPALSVLTGIVIYERLVHHGHLTLSRPAWIGAIGLTAVSVGLASAIMIVPHAEERVSASLSTQKEWEQNSVELGAYIQDRTGPHDVIFNYGTEPQVYFYADRAPPIPYFYDWVLKYDDEVTVRQIVADLETNKPVYVIDSIQLPLFEDWQEAHTPEWQRFLIDDYDYVGHLYFADVYRLKGYVTPPDAGAPND
jgi:4-amino-4-deoxy-L-arabinose transferase-like glycosyltransferase